MKQVFFKWIWRVGWGVRTDGKVRSSQPSDGQEEGRIAHLSVTALPRGQFPVTLGCDWHPWPWSPLPHTIITHPLTFQRSSPLLSSALPAQSVLGVCPLVASGFLTNGFKYLLHTSVYFCFWNFISSLDLSLQVQTHVAKSLVLISRPFQVFPLSVNGNSTFKVINLGDYSSPPLSMVSLSTVLVTYGQPPPEVLMGNSR